MLRFICVLLMHAVLFTLACTINLRPYCCCRNVLKTLGTGLAKLAVPLQQSRMLQGHSKLEPVASLFAFGGTVVSVVACDPRGREFDA